MNEAVIVSAVRTAVGKAGRGLLAAVRADELAAAVVREVLRRAASLDAADVEDVIMGCAIPEGEQGYNLARVSLLRAGLPDTVPGMTVNRFCSSGLQSIALAAQQIVSGMGECIVAGGVESMSRIPMASARFSPNPWLAENYPQVYAGMGQTAENVARRYGISRADQDEFSLRSHQRAVAAQDAGCFQGQILPIEVEQVAYEHPKAQAVTRRFTFAVDEGPRRDTSLAALSRLRPAFSPTGVVTAGNSSQTSDGAAATVIMERRKAEAMGFRRMVRFVGYAVGGVPPEIMGMGPIVAIPKVLRLARLSLADIGLIELNEAFASQSLAIIRELGLNEEITNVNGGAIALGHPLGCTGAKLTVQILAEMERRDVQFGLVSMCIGGGMGAAAVLERL